MKINETLHLPHYPTLTCDRGHSEGVAVAGLGLSINEETVLTERDFCLIAQLGRPRDKHRHTDSHTHIERLYPHPPIVLDD